MRRFILFCQASCITLTFLQKYLKNFVSVLFSVVELPNAKNEGFKPMQTPLPKFCLKIDALHFQVEAF